MNRPFLVTIGFTVLISVSLAFTNHRDPGYKNLQVLPKDITEKQLDSVMHHFNEALSVRCSFCHVRNDSTRKWDFASDDMPHKNKAREMMKMTNKINDDYFDVTGGERTIATSLMVTCYTCHHGSNDPAVRAPKKEEMQSPLRPLNDTTRRSQ
jgi:hypothetical protein